MIFASEFDNLQEEILFSTIEENFDSEVNCIECGDEGGCSFCDYEEEEESED